MKMFTVLAHNGITFPLYWIWDTICQGLLQQNIQLNITTDNTVLDNEFQ